MWMDHIRGEGTKFFSNHWCILGFLGAMILPCSALFLSEQTFASTMQQTNNVISLFFRFLQLGQIGIVFAMASFVGHEYTGSSLRTTLLAVSSRTSVLYSKVLVLILVTLVAGILSIFLCFVVLIGNYQLEINIDIFMKVIKPLFLILVSWMLLGLIAASLSIITKSFVVPVVILLPLILGLSQMLYAIMDAMKYSPDLAGMNLFLFPEQRMFLDSMDGLMVQLIWAFVLMGVSTFLFDKRDVRSQT